MRIDIFSPRGSNEINVVKDPFQASCLESIHMHFYPPNRWRASVDFKNGLTAGSQNFKSSSFEGITQKLKSFVESLEDNNEA